MSVNEKLDAEEAGGYGSIAPEPENDAVAYRESARHMRVQLEGRGREQLLRRVMDSSTATPPSDRRPPNELV